MVVFLLSDKRGQLTMSNKKLLVFLILLLVVNLTYAQDFKLVKGQDNLFVCPSSTVLYTTLVENTGSSLKEFSVSLSGSAVSWATAIPLGFILKPGESRLIYTYITPKSFASAGIYNLDVIVSDGVISESVKYTINIKDCYKLSVNSISESASVCPGDSGKFDFIVVNEGEFRDS